jgi:phosphoribosylformylglycinamidine synthase
MTRIGVVVFPGSNCDRDTLRGIERAGGEAIPLWHEQGSLDGAAAVVLPGGFAYGDYLRAGVIARFSPVMRAVSAFAADGGLVLGICNGFQVLAEAGLVPGALLRNRGLRFLGREVRIAPERLDTPFTWFLDEGRPLHMPIAHGEGCYFADEATLDGLEQDGQVLFRYVDGAGTVARSEGDPANPNGSLRAIAGVLNRAGNVGGLMPHPERAADALLGSDDGLPILRSLVEAAARAEGGPAVAAAGDGANRASVAVAS